MIENAVQVLNAFLVADPGATNELFKHKVRVNQLVCDHPTIQVRGAAGETEGNLTVLGLLNGVLQEANKVVVAEMEIDGTILQFSIGTLKNGRVSRLY